MALGIAGGVESMSRAPFVMPKQADAFGRNAELYDTTLGWRFVNKKLEEQYGIDSMAETAENVAAGFLISREDQDAFALRSQLKAEAAMAAGRFDDEIIPVSVPQRRGDDLIVAADEHPRPGSTLGALAKLRPIVRSDGTITAGNASGINDGACAMLIASEDAATNESARATGARCRLGGCWRRASHHGHWSGARIAKSARDLRIDDRTDGRYRTERGLCSARPCDAEAARRGRRRGQRQSQWRCDCPRTPAGHVRGTPRNDCCLSATPQRWPLCTLHDVHRRRTGYCHDY